MNLKDKVILVTGSSKGLGKITAEKLLSEGAYVIGWSRSETAIDHPNFRNHSVDVGNEEAVKTGFQKILDEFKTIDGIVNNAGFGSYTKVEETSSDTIHKMFETNVFGIFYLTKLAVPVMKQAGSGHIVNISSIAGIMGMEKMSVYNATKFAVKGMSEALFKELRKDGIKVSCIMPGSIQTDFFDDLDGYTKSNTMMDPADVADSILYCLKAPQSFHPVNLELRPFVN